MVFESIENQEAIGDGGHECNSTSFEHEASIDSNDVSFHRTVGALHIALNRVSKWCILVSFGGFILLRDDNQALWAVLGSVLNVVLSFTLKKIINQERPVSEVYCGPGMPSSHAQSISFATIFMILSSNLKSPSNLSLEVRRTILDFSFSSPVHPHLPSWLMRLNYSPSIDFL
ncbi:unnamed protein product [Lactuca virosa]|uniref:Dolichyldiphosphatase n=1 Tax=Lactuca virosa TaxID=75947 RepID=A0AAU9LIA3_9ASTR|nr:unnamed protein product [Lactuca virosa]